MNRETVDEPDSVAREAADAGCNRQVGQRLRTIRRQKELSLQEVEVTSAGEFKASVLGAYERGERAMSVPRLARLAEFYGVPVEHLLSASGNGGDGRRRAVSASASPTARGARPAPTSLCIDLRRVQALIGPEGELLKRYLAGIQVQRQDFNGRILTVRSADLQALSCLFGVPTDRVHQRMVELRLLLET